MQTAINDAFYIALQAGVVPVAESAPGQGKTAVLGELSRTVKRRFIQLLLSQRMPEDIGGVPSPTKLKIGDEEIRIVSYLPSEDLARAEHQPSILLLDELNHCSHAVLGAAQELINNPPKNSWVAAFQNPVEQSTSGIQLSPPVVNRVCMLKWDRHKTERRAGWRNGFKDYPTPDFPVVPPDFLDYFGPKWGALLCAYEDKAPQEFDPDETYPKDETAASQPWRSDRSWTNAGRLLAACDAVKGNRSTAMALVSGCIGEGPARDFMLWYDKQDLPEPKDILADPRAFHLSRFDIDRALLHACVGEVKNSGDPHLWESLCDLVEHVYGQRKDIAAALYASTWNAKPKNYSPADRNGVWKEMQEQQLEISNLMTAS